MKSIYTYLLPLAVAVFTFAATVILLRILIPILKSHKLGQKIYEIGPRWHSGKEGTPVMGGIAFIIPIAFAVLSFSVVSAVKGSFKEFSSGLGVLLIALPNGLIGLIDDWTKLIKKQNQGLKAWQKLGLQLLVASVYVAVLAFTGMINTELTLPFAGISVKLGFFYYIFLVLFIAATANAVNLTDGIDGLAASVTSVIALLFTVFAVTGFGKGLESFSAALFGGCTGFLVYNAYPAKIFMGDTGSLFLGGAVAGLALAVNNPLIVIVCGFVYIAEELSVILQVGYFKLTHGKRLFKMAPIHHHFEKCGWSERKIVAVFSAVTLVCCVLAWFGL